MLFVFNIVYLHILMRCEPDLVVRMRVDLSGSKYLRR